MSPAQTAYEVAVSRLDAMRSYTVSQHASATATELALLLAADTIACALLAIAEAMPEVRV